MSVRVMCLEAIQILMVVLFKRGQCMNKTQAIDRWVRRKEGIDHCSDPRSQLEVVQYTKTTMYTCPCKALFFMLIL